VRFDDVKLWIERGPGRGEATGTVELCLTRPVQKLEEVLLQFDPIQPGRRSEFNGRYWDDGQGHHRYGWGWNSARHCWQYAAPAQNDVAVTVSEVSSVPTGGVDTGDGSFGP
jgi:hypothetical protein